MTDNIYYQCMMCRRVWGGDLTKYNEKSKVSHVVCKDYDCEVAYLTYALGCTREDALSMLEQIAEGKDEKEKN